MLVLSVDGLIVSICNRDAVGSSRSRLGLRVITTKAMPSPQPQFLFIKEDPCNEEALVSGL